jgi:hypothetical protein
MRLWPDAVSGLGEDPTNLPKLNAYVEKRVKRTANFVAAALPLRGIYVLTDGGETAEQQSVQLKLHDAFRELCNHSYVLPLLRATNKLTHHFNQTVELIRTVPIRRLVRRKQHSALSELIELVQNDVAQHVS